MSSTERRVIRAVLVVVAVGAIAGLAGVAGQRASEDWEVVSIELFTYRGSVCQRYRTSSFESQVADVERTDSTTLRQNAASLRAGLVGQLARRPDLSAEVRRLLRSLSSSMATASKTDDFTRAEQAAAELDRSLERRCP